MKWHPEITERELIIQRRDEAKKAIKLFSGKHWVEYNRLLVSCDFNWLDAECRLIVALNNILRCKR